MAHSPMLFKRSFSRVPVLLLSLTLTVAAGNRPQEMVPPPLAAAMPAPAYGLRKQQAVDSPPAQARLAAGMEADAQLERIREKIRASSRKFGIPIPDNADILLFITRGTSGIGPRVTSKVFGQLSGELGLPRTYVRIPYLIEDGNVQEFLTVLKLIKQGFAVDGHPVVAATAGFPFKLAGTPLLDERDPACLDAEGTEFFARTPAGRLWGTLIDEEALADWYVDSVGSLEGCWTVVLGVGGVGSRFVEELVQRKAGRIIITDIRKERIKETLRRVSNSGISVIAVAPDDLAGRTISPRLHWELAHADAVFNLTTRGRRDVPGPVSPILKRKLRYKNGAVVVDAVPHYLLQKENILTQAQRVNRNVRTEDGSGMANYSNSGIIVALLKVVAGVNVEKVEKRKVRGLVYAANIEEQAAGMEESNLEADWAAFSKRAEQSFQGFHGKLLEYSLIHLQTGKYPIGEKWQGITMPIGNAAFHLEKTTAILNDLFLELMRYLHLLRLGHYDEVAQLLDIHLQGVQEILDNVDKVSQRTAQIEQQELFLGLEHGTPSEYRQAVVDLKQQMSDWRDKLSRLPPRPEAAGAEEIREFETIGQFRLAYLQQLRSQKLMGSVRTLRVRARRNSLPVKVWFIPRGSKPSGPVAPRVNVRVFSARQEEQSAWETQVDLQLNQRAGDRLEQVFFAVNPAGEPDENVPAVVVRQTGSSGSEKFHGRWPVIVLNDAMDIKALVPSWVYWLAMQENLRGQTIGSVFEVLEMKEGHAIFV